MNRTKIGLPALALALGVVVSGCEDKPSAPLAPSASALSPTKPATADAQKFVVDKPSSKVEFMMEAPIEKIHGRVSGATEGELQVDPTDITKTTGFLAVDISGIELFQQEQDKTTKQFKEEKKSDLQNEHARQWLEISPDAPEDVRKKNSRVEFAIRSIEGASEKNVQKMTGAERKVTLKAKGDFLMHGRKTEKTAELEATFKYDGDKPVSVTVKTTKPFPIGLEEHDVRPRKGFGVIAGKLLSDLSDKVNKDAMVSIEITAKAGAGGASPAKTGEPGTSSSAKP